MPFQKNVFVDCPFDAEYLSLLRPLLFTVIDLGFVPRIALESLDSGRPRIEKIISLAIETRQRALSFHSSVIAIHIPANTATSPTISFAAVAGAA